MNDNNNSNTKQSTDSLSLIQFTDKPLRLYVYSSDLDNVREVVLIPNRQWGGEGLLGCGVGYVHHHYLFLSLWSGNAIPLMGFYYLIYFLGVRSDKLILPLPPTPLSPFLFLPLFFIPDSYGMLHRIPVPSTVLPSSIPLGIAGRKPGSARSTPRKHPASESDSYFMYPIAQAAI